MLFTFMIYDLKEDASTSLFTVAAMENFFLSPSNKSLLRIHNSNI